MYTIETRDLTKRYGKRSGIEDVNLSLEEGEVFGFLGPNGAGKSTTIRLLLDLIRPTRGEIKIFGVSPRLGGADLRKKIGYLPGTLIIEGRQKVGDLLNYFSALRGGVPQDQINDLVERLDLDVNTEVRTLSKGNKQKVGLVQAFMHRPRLLLLDEPTSGLDPLLQRVFLELMNDAKADGSTILISSHVLSEVQHTADRVGVIREGKMIAVERIDDIRTKTVRRVRAFLEKTPNQSLYSNIAGISDLKISDRSLECDYAGNIQPLMRQLLQDGLTDIFCEEPDLESTFFHYYDQEVKGNE